MTRRKIKRRHVSPAVERSDGADAFVPDPEAHEGVVPDDLAEYLGESFVAGATGADDSDVVLHEAPTVEELGGPFIETDARDEFGESRRRSSPAEPGEPEAFPTAVRSGRTASPPLRRRPA